MTQKYLTEICACSFRHQGQAAHGSTGPRTVKHRVSTWCKAVMATLRAVPRLGSYSEFWHFLETSLQKCYLLAVTPRPCPPCKSTGRAWFGCWRGDFLNPLRDGLLKLLEFALLKSCRAEDVTGSCGLSPYLRASGDENQFCSLAGF